MSFRHKNIFCVSYRDSEIYIHEHCLNVKTEVIVENKK